MTRNGWLLSTGAIVLAIAIVIATTVAIDTRWLAIAQIIASFAAVCAALSIAIYQQWAVDQRAIRERQLKAAIMVLEIWPSIEMTKKSIERLVGDYPDRINEEIGAQVERELRKPLIESRLNIIGNFAAMDRKQLVFFPPLAAKSFFALRDAIEKCNHSIRSSALKVADGDVTAFREAISDDLRNVQNEFNFLYSQLTTIANLH